MKNKLSQTVQPEHNVNRGIDERMEKLCKDIDIEAIKEKSAIALLHGVDKCRAPKGCESMQYRCLAQWCKYDGTKDRWPNDASSHYSRKR